MRHHQASQHPYNGRLSLPGCSQRACAVSPLRCRTDPPTYHRRWWWQQVVAWAPIRTRPGRTLHLLPGPCGRHAARSRRLCWASRVPCRSLRLTPCRSLSLTADAATRRLLTSMMFVQKSGSLAVVWVPRSPPARLLRGLYVAVDCHLGYTPPPSSLIQFRTMPKHKHAFVVACVR